MEDFINLRKNSLMMLATVPEVKEKASEVGLKARYFPEINAIEIYIDDIQFGVTFNGRTIKVGKSYYNMDKWLLMYKATNDLLRNFKPFKND